jgi:hypothetical protein
MQIQFQLSLDDYRAAQHLHATHSPWPLFKYILVYYIYPIIGLFFLVIGYPFYGDKTSNQPIPALIVCGIILVFLPIYMRIHIKNCYKRTRSDNGECKLTFGEERIGIEGQFTNGEMDWRAVKSFRENKKVFMLYLAPAKFLVIPKRVCTDEQITELRKILSHKIQPQNR